MQPKNKVQTSDTETKSSELEVENNPEEDQQVMSDWAAEDVLALAPDGDLTTASEGEMDGGKNAEEETDEDRNEVRHDVNDRKKMQMDENDIHEVPEETDKSRKEALEGQKQTETSRKEAPTEDDADLNQVMVDLLGGNQKPSTSTNGTTPSGTSPPKLRARDPTLNYVYLDKNGRNVEPVRTSSPKPTIESEAKQTQP